jgi:hypothetical protein
VRTALRAALLPAWLYILVAMPVTVLVYATADIDGQIPGLVDGLSTLASLVGICMEGWAGYRAMQSTRCRRFAILAGLLVAVLPDALLLLPGVVLEASRSAGLTATNLAAALAHNTIWIGLDGLDGLGGGLVWVASDCGAWARTGPLSIQRYLPPLSTRGRPRTHPLRRILDAIF